MTSSDLFVTAIQDARAGTPSQFPTGGVDAFLRCAPDWLPVRLAQEATALTAEIAGASQSALYYLDDNTYRCVALHPPHLESPLAIPQDTARFPWDIGTVTASRFMLVENAVNLRSSNSQSVDTTLGELGFQSAVHLPLWAGNRSMGAVHLYWDSRVGEWDDRTGALLRAIGTYTLERVRHTMGHDLRSGLKPLT